MKFTLKWSEVVGVFPVRAAFLEVLFLAVVWMAFNIPSGSWMIVMVVVLQALWVVTLEWLLGIQRLSIREMRKVSGV